MRSIVHHGLLYATVAAVASFAFPAAEAIPDVLQIDGGNAWEEDSWYVQVDGVMGGKSSGDLEFLTNGLMKFTGDIVLDGGGFSSVRRRVDLDLSDYAGVVVTLKADSYEEMRPPTGIHLQFGDSTSRYDFSSALAVPLSTGNEEGGPVLASVYLPMETFDRGSRGGWACRGDCRLDSSGINGVSVYVLFQEGDFDVQIHSIEAVREPRSFPSPPVEGFGSAQDVADLLSSTVASGGGLYDKSYVELCVAMYWSVLNTLLASSSSPFSLPDPIGVVICAGLGEAEQLLSGRRKQDAAWALRYTIDVVRADLLGLGRTSPTDLGWLPTRAEAEEMSVPCVGRTSPAEGDLYDASYESASQLQTGTVKNSKTSDDGSDGGYGGQDTNGSNAENAKSDPSDETALNESLVAVDEDNDITSAGSGSLLSGIRMVTVAFWIFHFLLRS